MLHDPTPNKALTAIRDEWRATAAEATLCAWTREGDRGAEVVAEHAGAWREGCPLAPMAGGAREAIGGTSVVVHVPGADESGIPAERH